MTYQPSCDKQQKNMANFLEAIENFANDFLCALTQSQADWRDYVSNQTRSVSGLPRRPVTGYEVPYDAALAAFCRLGRDPQNPTFDNPSTPRSGQCPIIYEITIEYRAVFQGTPQQENAVVYATGPISGIVISAPPSGGLFINAQTGNGPQLFLSRGGNGWTDPQILNVSYLRTDGQPDNCSGAPISPTNPPEGGGTMPYEPTPGAPIVIVPVGIVVLPPIINVNGELTIPIELNVDGITIDLSKNLTTGDIYFGKPGDGCCAPPVGELPPIDDPEEPPPPGSNPPSITGIFLRATVPDEASPTRIQGTYGPVLYVPRLGSIRFAHEIAGRRAWSEKIDITSARQYVPVPPPGFAYDFVINPVPSVEIAYSPVTLDE